MKKQVLEKVGLVLIGLILICVFFLPSGVEVRGEFDSSHNLTVSIYHHDN
jgi:hypothetical protein